MSVTRRNTFDIFDEPHEEISTVTGTEAAQKRKRKKKKPSGTDSTISERDPTDSASHEEHHDPEVVSMSTLYSTDCCMTWRLHPSTLCQKLQLHAGLLILHLPAADIQHISSLQHKCVRFHRWQHSWVLQFENQRPDCSLREGRSARADWGPSNHTQTSPLFKWPSTE